MSYPDYFRKLNFSAVASGVQNMKNNEFSKLTNPINQQIDGFQSDIEGLQKSLADQSASLGTSSSILEMVGGLAAQKGVSKLGGKLISKVKEKLISKAKEKLRIKDSKKESNENNEPEADVDAEPSKTDFSGETKSDVPDGDNPNEFAYSSDKPGVFQPNRAQRGETEGQEEMPEFENPDLELPAVEGEVAPAPPPNLPTPRDLNPENYGEELYDPDMIPFEGNMDTMLEEPEEQGEIQDLGEQFENTETPDVEQREIVDGPSELNELVSTDLQPTTMDMPQTELGTGAYQTKEPYGSGEGNIEMQTFSSNESSNAELAETDANDFHEQLDTGNAAC